MRKGNGFIKISIDDLEEKISKKYTGLPPALNIEEHKRNEEQQIEKDNYFKNNFFDSSVDILLD